MAKKEINELKVRDLQQSHMWSAVCALDKAFGGQMESTNEGINWTLICRAAYHAGAAKACQGILF